MGCDIHEYIELVTTEEDGKKYISSIGRIKLRRNYMLFSLMAGVRRYGDFPAPICEPKGLPENLGYEASYDYHLFVIPDDDNTDESGYCKRSRAEKWVAQGISQWTDERKMLVTNPDWHSPSWLTIEELEEIQRVYTAEAERIWNEKGGHKNLAATIAAMKTLREKDKEPRLVFWFDN